MRLAYADPPYLGCCKLYGHEHNDIGMMPWDGRCWDELSTHVDLIRHLDAEYAGWAYSLTSTSLRRLIEATDDVPYRIGSWVKPFAAFKRNVRIAYTWEPLFWSPARDSSKDGAPVGRDHIAEPITLRRGFTGAKPPRVNRWVLDLLGYVDGDEVTDLFPGTGGMSSELRRAVLM